MAVKKEKIQRVPPSTKINMFSFFFVEHPASVIIVSTRSLLVGILLEGKCLPQAALDLQIFSTGKEFAALGDG